MPPVEDFWTTALGKTGPVDVPLPPDNEPKAFAQRRRCAPSAQPFTPRLSTRDPFPVVAFIVVASRRARGRQAPRRLPPLSAAS